MLEDIYDYRIIIQHFDFLRSFLFMVSPGRILLTVFGVDIMWYGALIGAGFIIATLLSYLRAEKFGVKPDHVLDFVIFLIPASIIGARAYYVLFNWEAYSSGSLMAVFNTRSGGLAIHGGVIMGVITAYIVCRIKKEHPLDLMDLAAAHLALAQSIGRWGNFFNEEAHGTATDLPWAQIIDGVGYHPTFLYESVWCFLLFIFLFSVGNRRRFKGQITCLYFILYSLERFFVEGLRTDSLMLGPFRQAQVLSLVLFVTGIALYFFFRKRSSGFADDISEEKERGNNDSCEE